MARPLTLTEADRVHAGMRRRIAMLPGLAAMTVSVVVGCSGNRVSWRRRKPRSAQSSSEAMNRLTKTPSASRQYMLSLSLEYSSTPVPVQHQKDWSSVPKVFRSEEHTSELQSL